MNGRHVTARAPRSAWLELWKVLHIIMLTLTSWAAVLRREARFLLLVTGYYAAAVVLIFLVTLWLQSGRNS